MKTIKIVLFALFVTVTLKAQFKVLGNGSSILLGSYWTGGLKTGVITFYGYNMPGIYPVSAWYGSLGTESNYFASAYIDHIYANHYNTFSDGRIKENISKIDSAIYKIKLLNPVKYDVKESFYNSIQGDAKNFVCKEMKNRLGFVAQELQLVFPQSVQKEPTSGYYGISTMDLIPVLVAAVKEQQNIIDSLKKDIDRLKPGKSNLKSANVETNIDENKTDETAILYQNSPNPWNRSTNISYWLNNSVEQAAINIFDMNGYQMMKLPISGGNGSVTINANKLRPGIYVYNLQLSNGQTVDTKTMVLTQ